MKVSNIQPANITNYKNKPLSFKQISPVPQTSVSETSTDIFEVSSRRDAAIIDYLESAKKRDEKNEKLGIATIAITLGLFPLFLLYMHKINGGYNSNKTSKFVKNSFKSLKNEHNIPTLQSCKSINNRMRDFLQAEVNYSKATEEDLKKAGQPKRTNKLLLYGPPGTGKTYFAKIFAKTIDAEYLEIKYSDLNHRYIGQHLENIKSTFESIIDVATKNKDKKYVVTLNEIDAIIIPQQTLVEHGGGHPSFKLEERNVFLNYIDELGEKAPNVTIIGTTNRKANANLLDGAAMSRFNKKMEVDYPNKECLKEALMAHLKEIGEGEAFVGANKDKWDRFAESLVKRRFSFRDLNYVIDSSKQYYLNDCIKDKNCKFKFEYLEKARDIRDVTDGEAALPM